MASVRVSLGDLLTKYSSRAQSGDFSAWLKRLELVAKLKGLEDDLVSVLPLFLEGDAFAVYDQLEESVKVDYEKVKAALTDDFSEDFYAAYESFVGRKLGEEEAPATFMADLKRLSGLMGNKKEPDGLIKCAFLRGLPAQVRLQLKATPGIRKMSAGEVLNMAKGVLGSSGGAQGGAIVCAAGGGGGAKAAAAIKAASGCYRCGVVGHIAKECPSVRKSVTHRLHVIGVGRVDISLGFARLVLGSRETLVWGHRQRPVLPLSRWRLTSFPVWLRWRSQSGIGRHGLYKLFCG